MVNESEPNEANIVAIPADLPTFYVDSFVMGGNAYTMRLLFSLTAGGDQEPKLQILMSPQHAKMMALVLPRAVKEFEQQTGEEIHIPRRLLEEKGIDLERDW